MRHEVNEKVEQEGREHNQLDTSDRICHASQEVMRTLQVVLTEATTKGVDGEGGMLVQHMDNGKHDHSTHESNRTGELGGLLALLWRPISSLARVGVRIDS